MPRGIRQEVPALATLGVSIDPPELLAPSLPLFEARGCSGLPEFLLNLRLVMSLSPLRRTEVFAHIALFKSYPTPKVNCYGT